MSGVTGRGLTDGNALPGDWRIFVQPAAIEPSHVGFAALPAAQEYSENERSAVNRLLPGTSSADTATVFTSTGLSVARATTAQRPPTGAPVCPSFVFSVSSIRFPRFVFVPSASPVIVAPCAADARLRSKWIVMSRLWPGLTYFTLKRTNP